MNDIMYGKMSFFPGWDKSRGRHDSRYVKIAEVFARVSKHQQQKVKQITQKEEQSGTKTEPFPINCRLSLLFPESPHQENDETRDNDRNNH